MIGVEGQYEIEPLSLETKLHVDAVATYVQVPGSFL